MIKTYEWVSNPHFRKIFMVRGENSWEDHVNYFDNLITDKTQQAYAIFWAERHVGNCGLKYVNKIKKCAELWIYIGCSDTRGNGLGGRAIKVLLQNAIKHFRLTDIFVHVAENNKSAIRLYKKNGFFKHGSCSEEWKDRETEMLRMLWRAS